jgi:hypothetical protein
LDETDNAFPGSGDQLRVLTDGNRSPLLNFWTCGNTSCMLQPRQLSLSRWGITTG